MAKTGVGGGFIPIFGVVLYPRPPLTHSQFALKHVGHIGTYRGTPTPNTRPLGHRVLVQLTWPRSASTRKLTRVKDGCVRAPFLVL